MDELIKCSICGWQINKEDAVDGEYCTEMCKNSKDDWKYALIDGDE